MNDNIFSIPQLFILTIFCGFIIGCTTSYPSQRRTAPEFGMPSEPGKCYAKCLLNDQYDITIDSVPIYSNIENVEYTIDTLKIYAGGTEWVKKKVDRNCKSADPNDCLVWCLVQVPEKIRAVKVPKDPANAGDVSHQVYESKKFVKKGGYTEWREVVCADEITADLVARVQNALTRNGYEIVKNEADNVLGKKTKAALVQYQRDNGFPVGELDYETLEGLGIGSYSF